MLGKGQWERMETVGRGSLLLGRNDGKPAWGGVLGWVDRRRFVLSSNMFCFGGNCLSFLEG